MFNDIFGPELVLFFHSFIWKARIGIEGTEKGHNKEKRESSVLGPQENSTEQHPVAFT